MGMLNNIKELKELLVPPSNKLHSLEGDRKGQFAISINEQWRICFHFSEGNVSNVEIVDYHLEVSMKEKILINVHPVEILAEEFLLPLSISAYRLVPRYGT